LNRILTRETYKSKDVGKVFLHKKSLKTGRAEICGKKVSMRSPRRGSREIGRGRSPEKKKTCRARERESVLAEGKLARVKPQGKQSGNKSLWGNNFYEKGSEKDGGMPNSAGLENRKKKEGREASRKTCFGCEGKMQCGKGGREREERQRDPRSGERKKKLVRPSKEVREGIRRRIHENGDSSKE